MSKYIQTIIDERSTINIEISDELTADFTKGTVYKASPSPTQISKNAQLAFRRILDMAKSVAVEFGKQFELLEEPPEEVELSFGLKIDATADVLVAKAGSEAQFVVKLSWKQIPKR